MVTQNNIETRLVLDRNNTTLTLEGASRTGRGVRAVLSKKNEAGDPVVIDVQLSDEVLRNIIHALEGYR